MAREFSRSRRVGEQIQRELAQLIQQEVKDPRLGLVTVSAVEVSRDLSHAKVFVTRMDSAGSMADSLIVLQAARGFLRRELAHRMSLRVVPEIKFVEDTSIERGMRLSNLIDRAVSDDENKSND